MPSGVRISYDEEWILAHWETYRNWNRLCIAYNREHGTDIGYNTFKSHCQRNGLNFRYTNEQIEWLKENYPNLGCVKTAEAFNETFNEKRSAIAIKVKCKKLGLKVVEQRKKDRAKENTGRYHEDGTITEKQHGELYKKIDGEWFRVKELVMGKPPKGYTIVHLDCDIKNNEVENLQFVKKGHTIMMAKYGFWSESREITKTGLLACELKELINKEGA